MTTPPSAPSTHRPADRGTPSSVDHGAVADLRTRLRGRVVEPGERDFEALTRVMAVDVTGRPALLARPTDAADVVEVLRFSRAAGLPLTVRSGGHGGAGHGTVDGGVVVDVRDLTSIDLDLASRTVWAGAGLTAGELTAATAEHGLAVGFGDTGSVGISGITLGGGVGWLSRAHGLTIDNLLAAEVVTAAGEVLLVDDTSHPELFWALRGGGGNFGVVTRLRYRLRPVDGVVGGMLVLPATPEVVAGFVAAAEAAPEELGCIMNVMTCPPLPFVPQELHGQLVVMGLLCFAGPEEDGAAALAPFRALAPPLADLVRPIPYPEMFPPADPEYRPTAVSRTLMMRTVDLDLARTILGHLEASDAPVRVVQVRALGGAIARVPAQDTAYAHRSSRLMTNVAAFYSGPDDRPARAAWVAELSALLDQGDPGLYVNFLGDDGPDRVRAAYPGSTWDRLAAVKATYDPDNVFRRNHNVPPAAQG
ncbi:FAD-binding oxidoreductase [Actinotalea sp. K2]|uniref:FAD-binding oxidoreductase n=1 Tax=Actinotalea sp. K2 TaxID=2939438 RepID=UPI00201799BB|nr:FAD-binding oxidoreductase [Actinotalea sp. K2]MCL3860979.1 FAD-binding oxidoreductase [Actinotalea sp. K2]